MAKTKPRPELDGQKWTFSLCLCITLLDRRYISKDKHDSCTYYGEIDKVTINMGTVSYPYSAYRLLIGNCIFNTKMAQHCDNKQDGLCLCRVLDFYASEN